MTLIVLAVGFISFFGAMKWAVSGQEVVVPAVVGQDLAPARSALLAANLQVKVQGERYDRNVARGKVSVQVPTAGSRIKRGNGVNVIVSLGDRTNPIPDLAGTTVRAAQLLLGREGFELGTVSEIHLEDATAEAVVTQFPTPEASELVGNKIDVLVSRGREADLYVTPDLVGQDLNRALGLLERDRVPVAAVSYGLYQDVAKATVVRQVPDAGYPLREGESVRLEVSK